MRIVINARCLVFSYFMLFNVYDIKNYKRS